MGRTGDRRFILHSPYRGRCDEELVPCWGFLTFGDVDVDLLGSTRYWQRRVWVMRRGNGPNIKRQFVIRYSQSQQGGLIWSDQGHSDHLLERFESRIASILTIAEVRSSCLLSEPSRI